MKKRVLSGIRAMADYIWNEINKYKESGANGVLVGTSLMKIENKKEFLEGLR